VTLPDWLQPYKDAWEGFTDMRKRIRAPLTPRAITLTLNELQRLHLQGYDPGEVLDQSTQRSWRGVFPVYGQQPKRVLRDQHGSYEVTAEGMRRYIQLQ
jgi:hypothetical protein